MAIFTPLINYAGYAEHVLNAVPCFAHPNGTIYGVAIEKQSGTRQNLSVYRVRPGANVRELVHRYVGGGVDAASQIAAGGCLIDTTGALHVWASAVPIGIPPITKTGFVGGFWPPIPDVDEPWSSGGITLFDQPATAPSWEGKLMAANVGELVNIPLVFGVPPASAYLIRFVAQSNAADVRIRAGTEHAPYILTMNLPIANVQQHIQGWAPGPKCYVSTAQGAAQVWLQIVGF